MNGSVAAILRLTDSRGRIILGFYAAATSFVAILNLSGLIVPALGILSLLMLVLALAILSRPGPEPFALSSTVMVIALVLVITVISAWNLVDPDHPGYAGWHLGATTFLLLVLVLRGRRLFAWATYAAFGAIVIVAGITTERGFADAANDVARQAATLLIGTLFAIILTRTSATITRLEEAEIRRAAADASMIAATHERALQNARLDSLARPALDRILDERPFTEDDLGEFTLLEAALRDGIRAAGFSSDRLSAETRVARGRGLQVILLDDRGAELADEQRDRVETALIAEYRATRYGTITARLSPFGRDDIATIVVDEVGQYRRIVVTETTITGGSVPSSPPEPDNPANGHPQNGQ